MFLQEKICVLKITEIWAQIYQNGFVGKFVTIIFLPNLLIKYFLIKNVLLKWMFNVQFDPSKFDGLHCDSYECRNYLKHISKFLYFSHKSNIEGNGSTLSFLSFVHFDFYWNFLSLILFVATYCIRVCSVSFILGRILS